jgi:hypothetical protein
MVLITSRKTTPYRRILLGLSCADFISSMIYPWQAFLLPRDTSERVWAFGNDASCTFLGWGQQISFASVFYNGMLSIYFLLTVKYGVKNHEFSKKFEPWMHLLAIGYPLTTAMIGAGMGVFNELQLGQGCWVSSYPEGCGCDESKGEYGECCIDHWIGWIFGGLPIVLLFLVVLASNLLVFLHVKSTIDRGHRRITEHAVRISQTSSNDPQVQRIRAVAKQAFWYVAIFFIIYLPSFVLRVVAGYGYKAHNEDEIFALLLITQGLLLPSQGFWNLFVYVRPSYFRARKDYPHESKWWAFRRALYGERVKPTKDPVLEERPESSDFDDLVIRGAVPVLLDAAVESLPTSTFTAPSREYRASISRGRNSSDHSKVKDKSLEVLQEENDEGEERVTSIYLPERQQLPDSELYTTDRQIGVEDTLSNHGETTDALRKSSVYPSHRGPVNLD